MLVFTLNRRKNATKGLDQVFCFLVIDLVPCTARRYNGRDIRKQTAYPRVFNFEILLCTRSIDKGKQWSKSRSTTTLSNFVIIETFLEF